MYHNWPQSWNKSDFFSSKYGVHAFCKNMDILWYMYFFDYLVLIQLYNLKLNNSSGFGTNQAIHVG